MSSRYRKPETRRLTISRDDWLLVKKHLTSGEERQMYARMASKNGSNALDIASVQPTKIAAYLLDWSLTDADEKPVVVADRDFEDVVKALDNLPPEDFKEILQAIEAHETEMSAARENEIKNRLGGTTSSPASLSAESSTGLSTTSTPSIEMSVA